MSTSSLLVLHSWPLATVSQTYAAVSQIPQALIPFFIMDSDRFEGAAPDLNNPNVFQRMEHPAPLSASLLLSSGVCAFQLVWFTDTVPEHYQSKKRFLTAEQFEEVCQSNSVGRD